MNFGTGSKVITPPQSEPVDLAAAKNWVKVESDVTEDDALIQGLIVSSRIEIENQSGLAFMSQTIEDSFDGWPDDYIKLLRYPVQSVESVKYIDSDGVEQTLPTPIVDDTGNFCRVQSSDGWPTVKDQMGAIKIRYVAGWANADSVPQDLKTAVLLMLTYFYEKRADSVKRFKTAAEHIVSKRYVHIV